MKPDADISPALSTRDPAVSVSSQDAEPVRPILFFDGVCGLCNRTVDFVIRRDSMGQFRFAPLQGETAGKSLTDEDITNLSTLVLVDGGAVYRRSAAVVRILWRLGSIWKVLGTLLWLVPRPLRDVGYGAVSALRYRLFGKKESCRLPTPEERDRFLP